MGKRSYSQTEVITITASRYLSQEFAEKIAAAQWGSSESTDGIRWFTYNSMVNGDCFNVIAQNDAEEVVGRLFCIRNLEDETLWYYGDIFVKPNYRRRHIAQRMLSAAIEILEDKGCKTLRVYTNPDNAASIAMQTKTDLFKSRIKLLTISFTARGSLCLKKNCALHIVQSLPKAVIMQNIFP